MTKISDDLLAIASMSIEKVLPDSAIETALKEAKIKTKPYVIGIGKAAWRMAKALSDRLEVQVAGGIVITKYGHSEGHIPNFRVFEAGHPVLDEAALFATREAIAMAQNLKPADTLIFLISGGGSALFELPVEEVSLEQLKQINMELINSGASIEEINLIRKQLSQVKGGGFLNFCGCSKILAFVLSDVIGNPLASIASGPLYPEAINQNEVKRILEAYPISFAEKLITRIEAKELSVKRAVEVETHLVGSVEAMCEFAAKFANQLGYETIIREPKLQLSVDAFLDLLKKDINDYRQRSNRYNKYYCLIYGGELTLKVSGSGKGGRSQHTALKVSQMIEGDVSVHFLAQASDGTDGPTDAAGGIVDSLTASRLRSKGIDINEAIINCDAYHALQTAGALIISGPTGTNVNDLMLCVIAPNR